MNIIENFPKIPTEAVMCFTRDPRLSGFDCPVFGFRKLDTPEMEISLWNFLCSSQIVCLMEEGSNNGEPVVDRISGLLVEQFGLNAVTKDNFRQLTGKMIRPIMEKINFSYSKRGPTKNGIFVTSAIYSPNSGNEWLPFGGLGEA